MAKKSHKGIEGSRCPLCNGTGVIFNDLEEMITRKLNLLDSGKISVHMFNQALYEYLFLKYGFTPSIGEASIFFEIDSLKAYRDIFLPRIQKIASEYVNGKSKVRLAHEKRNLSILETDDGSITPEATEAILKTQDFKCAICNLNIVPRNLRHLDHKIPVSRGGTHRIENVQWLCVSCNVHKHNKIDFNGKNQEKNG